MSQAAGAPEQKRSASRSGDTRPTKRNRITLACKSCRQRKSRCDGTRPRCLTCVENGLECAYSNTETLTKSSASKESVNYSSSCSGARSNHDRLVCGLESRVATVEEFLSQLSSRVTRIENGVDDEPVNPTSFSEEVAPESRDPTDGIGTIVFTEEEHSGFFGPTSNIAFTRQIVRTTAGILKHITSAGAPVSPNDTPLKSHVVHMSRADSPSRNLMKSNGYASVGSEPFILPPETTMMQLIELYFNTTGSLFPFIDRNGFWKTYRQLITTNMLSVRRSWLGLLNMVFAITTSVNTTFDLTITAQTRAAKSDIFFQRAMELSDRQIRLGTSLEVVQLLLLASMYSQGTERSIETWNIHGLAVKAAYQLGLHSPDALRQYPLAGREIRKRVWFACVVLDRTLSMTLGRPVSIPEAFVKVDLPSY